MTEPLLPLNDAPAAAAGSLRRLDYLGLAAFCLVLFGYAAIGGRPLTLHEARLPECSREMMAGHDWLVPRSGGRPWLERPPLPHWVLVATSALLGQRCDRVWVVRLPSAVMGCVIVLLTAWIAARLRGRGIGLTAGLVLATSYEFYKYSTLAEDDIFLAAFVAAAVALFVAVEFPRGGRAADTRLGFLGGRPWPVIAIFAVVGISNIVKGLLLGTVVIGVTALGFLLWADRRRVLRYVWLWGWLIFALLAAAWPAYILHRFPNVRDNWAFDYSDTKQYDNPLWYYSLQLPGLLMPWTPAVIVGLWAAWRQARGQHSRGDRFVLAWTVLPVLLLSVPHRKHHHYLVPSLAPWAIVGAIGLTEIARRLLLLLRYSGGAAARNDESMTNDPMTNGGDQAHSDIRHSNIDSSFVIRHSSLRSSLAPILIIGSVGVAAIALLHCKIPGPPVVLVTLAATWVACVAVFCLGLQRRSRPLLLGAIVGGFLVFACWGQTYLPEGTEADTRFLRAADDAVPPGALLLVNADLRGEMDFFRNAFYLRPTAVTIHNLSFLRDERFAGTPVVYVVTRAAHQAPLEQLGSVEPLLASAKTRRERSPADRFTLFRLTFRTDLQRYPAPPMDSITQLQAMGRASGPWLGAPLEAK